MTVAQALHWLDLEPFYAEARRVLVPNGVLAVWCYGLLVVDEPVIDGQLEHFYGRVVGPYWPPDRRLVETGYRTVDFPFDEMCPPAFDMSLDWTLRRPGAYLGTWSATEAISPGAGRGSRRAVRVGPRARRGALPSAGAGSAGRSAFE